MKRLLFFIVLLTLCSCGDEYKAKRFVKNLDGNHKVICVNVNDEEACVYYRDDDYSYYKYDVKTEESSLIVKLNRKNFMYETVCSGQGCVYYSTESNKVIRYNLSNNEKTDMNRNGDVQYKLVFANNEHAVFYDGRENVNCLNKLVHFNAKTSEYNVIKLGSIDYYYQDYFDVQCIHDGGPSFLIAVIQDKSSDIYNQLYSYDLKNTKDNSAKFLCKANRIWSNVEIGNIKVMAMDYNAVAVYNLQGRKEREFATIYSWPSERGLSYGNMIDSSSEYNILCYIATNDEDSSSVPSLCYYDGNTGQEVKINMFTKPNGGKVSFKLLHDWQQNNIKVSSCNRIIFCGTIDMYDYALLYFDYATREVGVIARGNDIYIIRDHFKVTSHNGCVTWYNSDGWVVEDPTRYNNYYNDYFDEDEYYDRLDNLDFYGAGAELGKLFNGI